MKPLPGQMVLNLFPEEQPKCANPLESMIRWLVDEHLCPEEDVRPYVERAFREFGRPEAVDRAHELPYFYSAKRKRRVLGQVLGGAVDRAGGGLECERLALLPVQDAVHRGAD